MEARTSLEPVGSHQERAHLSLSLANEKRDEAEGTSIAQLGQQLLDAFSVELILQIKSCASARSGHQ